MRRVGIAARASRLIPTRPARLKAGLGDLPFSRGGASGPRVAILPGRRSYGRIPNALPCPRGRRPMNTEGVISRRLWLYVPACARERLRRFIREIRAPFRD